MAKGCDCTIGWVTDPDLKGTAEMVPISCTEYRGVLWQLRAGGDLSLSARQNRILRKALEEGWK